MVKYNKKYSYALGIDLGTSNSCAAIRIGKDYIVIEAKEGVSKQGKTLASCVSFTDNQILVGDAAKNRLIIAPEETVYQAKRYMGSDKIWNIRGKAYRPEQISAYILSKLKEDAEAQIEAEITDVVITVPAQFDDIQRKATADAAKIAGLNCIRLINEPTAAALAYDFDNLTSEQRIIVADLGGGTFDVSMLKCEESVFEVVATGGDTKLGGKDIDDIMMQYVKKQILDQLNITVGSNLDMEQKIRDAVEITKISLSNLLTTTLMIPFLTIKDNKPVSFSIEYSRALLEQQIKPILDKVKTVILNTIKESGIDKSKITKLLLVGGPMNMPILKKLIEDIVGISASTKLNPNNCVAIGASKQAAALSSSDDSSILLLDVTPLSLGVEVESGLMSVIIQKNSHVPIKNVQKYTTAEDNQPNVEIKILQGERTFAKDNKLLNTFRLENLPKMKRGQPIIEVTFEIDSSGILNVTAEESSSKIKQSVTVINSKNLSQDEIDRMVQEAAENKEKDEQLKKNTEILHNTKNVIYNLEETKKDTKLNITDEDIKSIDNFILELNEYIKEENYTKMNARLQEIQLYLSKLLSEKAKSNQPAKEGQDKEQEEVTPETN
jgi:molecular chaperone DnaK